MRKRLLALAGAVLVAALVAGLTGPAGAGGPPRAQVRGCAERVEGVARLKPDRRRDTVAGPLALLGLPRTWRDFASRSSWQDYPGSDMPAMKALAWLRAGQRVTLVVPPEQRRWMRVVYQRPLRRGLRAVTLKACRTFRSARARRRECRWPRYRACRRGYTEFNGGIELDFANAPDRGRCAELEVWVRGRDKPLRKRLFAPPPGSC